jgi:isoleucyl-tRNA synthetase
MTRGRYSPSWISRSGPEARSGLVVQRAGRIRLWVDEDARVRKVTLEARESISRETLAAELHVGPEGLTGKEEELTLNGLPTRIRVERA